MDKTPPEPKPEEPRPAQELPPPFDPDPRLITERERGRKPKKDAHRTERPSES